MKQKLLLIAMGLLGIASAQANNKDYFFDRLTVTASGAGKVYASTEADATPEYAESITLDELGSENAASAPTKTIYLFAQPEEGYSVEWVSDDLEVTPTAEDNTTATVVIGSQENDAAVKNIVARFYNAAKLDGKLTLADAVLELAEGAEGTIAVAEQEHDGSVTWTSSAPAVVSIDAATGAYTALAEGVAVITASLPETDAYGAVSATCTVSVERAKSLYQVQNGGFELWDDEDNKSIEPRHWNSFTHATGSMASMVNAQQVMKSNEVRPGSAGVSSVRIYARNVMLGIAAQGNLTTGRINGGSMNATDANGNYNYTDTSDADFNQPITGLPDAIHVWVKSGSSVGGSITCNLHTTGDEPFQDPTGSEEGHTNAGVIVVAHAGNGNIAQADEWQELTIPFEYNEEAEGVRPEYALVTLTTSGTPGQGATTDWMLVDDFEFVYNSELATAEYNGQAITFAEDGTATVSDAYDADRLTLAANGQGATIDTAFDEATNTLTITVSGDNVSEAPANTHTYTVTFDNSTAIGAVAAPANAEAAPAYDLAGRRTRADRPGIFVVNGKTIVRK